MESDSDSPCRKTPRKNSSDSDRRQKAASHSNVSILHTIHQKHVMCNGASKIVQFVKSFPI